MLADCRTRGIQCGKQRRRPTERWKNDMIADRHRRRRRKPRRTGGGATWTSVASHGDYAGVNRLLAFQSGELNANEDGITGTNWMDPVHDRVGNMPTIPEPANLAGGLTATYDAWKRLVELKDGHGDLTNRYLHGPAVDQILADEQVDSLAAPGEVLWPLTDNLGTVRDLAVYDDATGITAIVNHRMGSLVTKREPLFDRGAILLCLRALSNGRIPCAI